MKGLEISCSFSLFALLSNSPYVYCGFLDTCQDLHGSHVTLQKVLIKTPSTDFSVQSVRDFDILE